MLESPAKSNGFGGALFIWAAADRFVFAALTMVVSAPICVPIVVLIPFVVVFNPSVISIPVTGKVLLSVVVRFHPSSTCIWRARIVALMPLVVPSYWIPIAADPHELRTWTCRHNANHTGTRRRTNSNAERDLSLRCRCPGE